MPPVSPRSCSRACPVTRNGRALAGSSPARWPATGPAASPACAGSSDPDAVARATRELALLAEAGGAAERTASLVAAVPDVRRRAELLTALARAAIGRGDRDRATELARAAERTARRRADLGRLARAADHVVDGLIVLGALDEAITLAGRIPEPERRESALGRVAAALAGAGRVDQARELADRLGPERRAWGLATIAQQAVDAGDRGRGPGRRRRDGGDDRIGPGRLLPSRRADQAGPGVGRAGGSGRLAGRCCATPTGRQAGSRPTAGPGRSRCSRWSPATSVSASGPPSGSGRPVSCWPESTRTRCGTGCTRDSPRHWPRSVTSPRPTTTWAWSTGRPPGCGRRAPSRPSSTPAVPGRCWPRRRARPAIERVEDRAPALARLAVTAATVGRGVGAAPTDPAWTLRPVAELLTGEAWSFAAPALAHLEADAARVLASWVTEQLGTAGE